LAQSFTFLGKWVGAATIGANFAKVVREHRVRWTADQLLTDVDRSAAVLEWTRFNPANGQLIRGVEGFDFEPNTLKIKEVRPYTAAPIHPDMARQELQDFDYEGRGYPTVMS
jgi:methyltransferase